MPESMETQGKILSELRSYVGVIHIDAIHTTSNWLKDGSETRYIGFDGERLYESDFPYLFKFLVATEGDWIRRERG